MARGQAISVNLINQKVKSILQDAKNSNELVDIITCLDEASSCDDSVQNAAVKGVERVFTSTLFMSYLQQSQARDDSKLKEQFSKFVSERFRETISLLLSILCRDSDSVQLKQAAFVVLMKFLTLKPAVLTPEDKVDQVYCDKKLFGNIVDSSLPSFNILSLLYDEYIPIYDDLKLLTLKCLQYKLTHLSDADGDTFQILSAMFDLLTKVNMSHGTKNNLCHYYVTSPDISKPIKGICPKTLQRIFSAVWLQLLSLELSAELYRKVLVIIHDKVMPFMDNPLLLADFLTKAYAVGGAVSLLALNGLFTLIQKYHLDYPNFYEKLYTLFEPEIFSAKYKARFFYLSNLFLSSSHLPSYLAAAFIKRLSRLSLCAPPNVLLVIIPFIHNLLCRHPICKKMLMNSKATTKTDDPYNNEESDLMLCGALESSVWEVESVCRNHYYPAVSVCYQQLRESKLQEEVDLSELLDKTMDDIYWSECKRSYKETSLKEEPRGLIDHEEGVVRDLWRW